MTPMQGSNYAIAFSTFYSNVPLVVMQVDFSTLTTSGGSLQPITCQINLVLPYGINFLFIVSNGYFIFLWQNDSQSLAQIQILQDCLSGSLTYSNNINQIIYLDYVAMLTIPNQNKFIMAWSIDPSDIAAQFYQSNGQSISSIIQIDTSLSFAQSLSMSIQPNGEVIISWSSPLNNIFGQVIQTNNTVRGFLNCQSGQYEDNVGTPQAICQNCGLNCQVCTNPTLCTQCNTGTFLLTQGSQAICVNICPNGMGPDQTNTFCQACASNTYYSNGYCLNCDSSCATCSGPSSNACLSCLSNIHVLDAGTCHECPIGTYFNNGVCSLCDASCVTCSGPTPIQCLSCRLGLALITGACLQCTSGTYYSNGVCLLCDSSCIECSGSASNQCLLCPLNRVLVSGECQECPFGTYYSNGICNSCDSSCQECLGPASNQCVTCTSDRVFIQGTCQNDLTTISASLTITSDPSCVSLQLQPRVQSLIDNLKNFITLSINYEDYVDYTYSLNDTDETIISIIFSFSSYLPPSSILSLNFTFENQVRGPYTISPMKLKTTLLEYYPYSTTEVSMIQSSQQAASATITMSQVATGVITISSPSSSTVYTVIQCVDLFSMVRFLDIAHPPNAMALFSQIKVQPISLKFLPNVFNLIPMEQVDLDFVAPFNFSFYNVKLFILENFGGHLYQFSIMIITALFFILMSILPIKLPLTIGNIFLKIQDILVWNFILSFLFSNYFDGVMFIFIQLFNMSDNTPYQLANLIACSLCVVYLAFPFITFWISLKHYKALGNNNEQAPLSKYGSLLKDYRHDNIIQTMYATLCLIRGFFAFGILVWKSDSPLTIIITLIVLCLGMINILIKFKPFIKMKGNLLSIGCEMFNLAIYVVVLILILIDVKDIDTRNILGFIILHLNTALYIWITGFSIYTIAIIALDNIKQFKKSRVEKAKLKYQDNTDSKDNNNMSHSNVRFDISKRLPSKHQDDTLPMQESQIMSLDLSIAMRSPDNHIESTEYISNVDDPRLKSLTQKVKLTKFYSDDQNFSLSAVILDKSSSITSLDLLLENEEIQDNDLAMLSKSLIACKNLTEFSINLSRNQIGNEGIDALANTLSKMNNLTDLRINLNKYNSYALYLAQLRILSSNQGRLTKPNALKKLKSGLESQKHLNKLDLELDSLNLGNEIIPLIETLSKLKLTHLHLSISDNNISNGDLLIICGSYLPKLTKLQSFGLELNRNLMTSLEFKALGLLIMCYKGIKELKLSLARTNITPEIMTDLALDISKNQTITNISLDLSENKFCLMGIESLKDSINIENLFLKLTDCGIKTENLRILSQIISCLPNLKTINLILTKNNIDIKGRTLLNDWLTKRINIVNISVAF